MARQIGAVIILDRDADALDRWASEGRAHRVRMHLCRAASEALAVLEKGEAAVLVARIDAADSPALPAIRAARDAVPPPQVVVLTERPDEIRRILKEERIPAEILRPGAAGEILGRFTRAARETWR
jgi:hypothetical protein